VSAPELVAEHAEAAVYRADWRDLLAIIAAAGGCDAVIVDAPYSERTHSGHEEGTETANTVERRLQSGGRSPTFEARASKLTRRPLNYPAWGAADVDAFVAAWAPLARGWFVTITDHELAPYWAAALVQSDRYVFAPLAFVAPGSRVRLSGDGPAQWSTWVVVARPRERAFASWGALPGAYVLPPGYAERMAVVGGKPLWLMEALVRDYSRPTDLIVDPCCGAGTTLIAAQRNARRAVGGDLLREHAEIAAARISRPAQQPLFGGEK
jgi:hypothetical protein